MHALGRHFGDTIRAKHCRHYIHVTMVKYAQMRTTPNLHTHMHIVHYMYFECLSPSLSLSIKKQLQYVNTDYIDCGWLVFGIENIMHFSRSFPMEINRIVLFFDHFNDAFLEIM